MNFSGSSIILGFFLLFLLIAMCMGCFYVCSEEDSEKSEEESPLEELPGEEFSDENINTETLDADEAENESAMIARRIVPNALNEEEGMAQADDLKQIKGIGVKLEKLLNSLGVYTFKQIANWSKEDAAKVDTYLKFPGRIERDEWIRQAREFLAQKE